MQRKWLGLVLAAGLAIGTVSSASAEQCQTNPSSIGTGMQTELASGDCAPGNKTGGATGSGTAGGGVVTTTGMEFTPMTDALLRQSVINFWAYTSKNWSQMGFDSAQQARNVLGGDWYGINVKMVGADPSVGMEVRRDCDMTQAEQGRSAGTEPRSC